VTAQLKSKIAPFAPAAMLATSHGWAIVSDRLKLKTPIDQNSSEL